MPNPNDNRKWLYDKLTEKGVKMGTYEQFDKAIDDENNLKWVYDKASSQGLKVGDYNQFSGALKRVAAEAPATAEKPVAETVQPAESTTQAAPETPATEKVEEKPALTDSYKVPEINTPFTQPERPDVPVPFAPETPVNSTEVKNTDEKAAAELREQTERDVQRYGTGNADYTFEEAVSAGREYERIAPEIAKYDERLKAFKDKYGPMEEIVKEVNEGKRKLTQEEYRKLQAQYPGYDKEAKALSELGKSYDAVLATAPGREYQAVSKRMDEIGKGAKTPEAVLEYAQEFSKLQRNPLYRAQLGENAPSEDEIQSDWLQAQIAYFDEKMKTATGDEKKELKKAFSDAKEALYANPYYRKHLEGKVAENKEVSTLIGEELAKRRNELTAEWASKNGGAPDAWSAQGFEQWVQGDQEMKNLYAAAHMVDDAIREYQKPTKYDDSRGLRNVGKGLADWAGNTDTWSFGVEQFAEDIGVVRPILEKVEKLAGSLDLEHLTDSAMDELEKQLTQGEQAVLLGYFEKIMAVAAKGADTSIGYQIGQGIGDMVNLGVEMALTGPVGGAVRKGIDKAGMAAMKKLLTKRMYRQFAKSGVGRVALWTGHKAVRDVFETAARIPFMPSTYKAIGEGSVELSSDYKTRDFWEYAPEKSFDNFVEQLTEVSNGFAFPLIGKVMKMRGMKNFVTSVIGKDSAKALRTFIERGDIKLLDDMMIGSFGGEWEEELLGAVIHSVTDDPNALRDFFSAEQQLVLLGTLAPIPLVRGTAGGVQLAVPAAQAALAWNKAESELKRLGFDEGRIARLKEVVDNASAPEGARAIMQAMKDAGFSRSTAEGQGFLDAAGSPENDVLYGSVPEIDRDAYDALAHYYWRAQQKRAAGLMGEVEQDRKVRDKRAELKSKYGQFWHNEMGEEVVETGTIIGADGNPLNVFIASDEPMEDGRVAYVGEDGSNGFLSRDQLVGQNADGTFAPNPETTVTPINIYLAGLVMQDSQVQEAQGVVNEASAANTSLRDQIEGLADVKYKGQSGTITRADDNGAIFVPDDGENVRVTWAELAAENGIQEPEVKTPAERTVDAAALVAEHTRLKQELAGAFRQASDEAGKNGRGALMETEEGTATVVNIISDTIDPENGTAQFTVRMPDGSMNVTMATAIEPVMSQLRGESAPEPEPEPAPAPAPAPGPQPPAGGAGGAEMDFRGNPIPMKDGEVDEEAFREKDPEAWAAWNDALPEDDPRKATLGTKKRLEGLAKSAKSAADKAQKDLEKLYDKGATDKEIREKETEIRDQRARQKRYEDAIASIDKRDLDKAEAEREAARKAAEAERLRREKEKEEEEKRKAGKAPDISEDTPEAAQKRGYIMVNGNRIDRPTPDAVAEKGKDTKIAFTKSVAVDGKYGLVEATRIEPSHISDQENPLHFFAKKWQPKNRKRADSAVAIQQMANGIRPGEITRGETAYGGAPIVNERGEVIQGNGRSEALRRAYGQGTAAEYKAWLAEHAEEFGLTREQVEKMETPILVRVLDVDDARAEQLGKMEQKDLESGGDQRFNGKTLVKKMGRRFGEFLDYLFAGDLGDDATALDYINQNGYTALHWLHQNGFINDTEYANAQDNGKLTEETVSAFRAMSIEPLFDNVPEKVRSGFEMLPNSVKLALQRSVATLYGLEGVIGDIQDALAYYCDFETSDPTFKKAKNTEEAWNAVTAWMQNSRLDGTSEGEAHPSIVARRFASIFKGGVLVEGEKNPKRTEKAYRSLFANIASTMRGEGGFMSAAEPTDNIGAYRENNVITEEEENQIRNGKNDNRPGPASGSGANGPVGGQGSGAVREGRPGGVPERKPAGEGAGPVAPEAPANPAPETPAGFGANNKLFTKDARDKAREIMLRKLKGQLNAGIDPEMLTAMIQYCGYYIEAGVRTFVEFAKTAIADLGDAIRPYLKSMYTAVRHYPGMEEYAKEMTPYDEVEKIDVDAIGKKEEPVEDSQKSIDLEMKSMLHGLTERIMSQMGGSTIQQETIIDRRNDLGFVTAQSLFYFTGGGVTTKIVYDFKDGKHENGRIEITRTDSSQFGGIQKSERTFALDTPFEEIASAVKTMGEEKAAEPAPAPEAKPKEAAKPTTKDGWLKKMSDVYKELCNKFKVPEDPLVQTGLKRYNFDYSATKGYTLDALEKYYEEYRKKLEDAVEPATEKQLAYIDRLADEQDKEILKGVTLNKVSAGYVISILKAAEDAISSRMSTEQEFVEYENELRRVAELNGKTENKPENSSESPEKSVTLEGEKEARDKFTDTVAARLVASIASEERPFKSITDLRKAAREAGMEVDDRGATDILIQELTEVAIVRAARKFMSQFNGGLNSRNAFNAICKLYEMQPTISMRSSQRVAMQQYSTPLHMSFVAQMFAYKAGMKDVLEPTAGNGMLVFGIPADKVHANELDDTRKANLDAQGFKEVTQNDATEPFSGKYDAVIANPPFGSHDAVTFDGKSISGLDPVITLRALDAMKDDGKAAIIIGGNVEWAENGSWKTKKAFFAYLYDHYNVKGVVNMAGDMYARQGTSYPTTMILIDGRRSEEDRAKSQVFPPVSDKARKAATTNDELFDIVTEILNDDRKTDGNEVVRTGRERKPAGRIGQTGSLFAGDDSAEPAENGTDGRGNDGGAVVQGPGSDAVPGKDESGAPTGSRPSGERSGTERDVPAAKPGELAERPADSGGEGVSGPVSGGRAGTDGSGSEVAGVGNAGREQPEPVPGGESSVRKPVRLARKVEDRNLAYVQHSSGRSLESVAPAAMVEAMDAAIQKIEKEQGRTIDEFVTEELGYESTTELHKALAAEQIDSVAMAIYQMKKGKAMIIGDQTGVGKGRQMAALIRWANRQGKKPIFMTQKAGLFSDIYRDLRDIGSGNLKPLILNSADKETDKNTGEKHWKDTAGVMLDEDGKLVYRSPESGLDKIIESGKVPDGYDFVVLTYSQLNSGDQQSRSESRKKVKEGTSQKSMAKAAYVRQIANDNYILLDESHTAAGEGSNSGAFLRSVMPSVKGVTFSSATFAKRPDTMPLYAIKSAMSEANVEPDKLIGMIKKGGVTLQEIMARALTGSGQMVRRERDMSDVRTDWKTVDDPETAKKARANYDRAIEIFNKIISFQRNFITPVIKDISDDLAETMSVASETSGTRNFGVDNPPFVNQTYNFTKQLMLALKAEAIVEEVIKEIKAGRHPVIALENTYESGLDGYNVGDKIEDTSFSGGLTRSFERILQYTVTDPDGNKSQEFLSPEELGPEAARQYYALQEEIKEATKEIFLSPLDLIKQKLSEQGYKVGEVTGRKTQVVKEDDGYYLRQRTGDAKQAVREFNSGESDVIIINKSGSTGISLHSSVAFKDQRQRSMIIAQPLGDINDYMQMIGRIDRTGQVHRGYYINLSLPVPAETRFNMMLATKLKSLNANTTTSQESDTGSVDAPDFLNKYGSQVVIEYLRDHPEVFGRLVETGMMLGSRPNFVTTSTALESYRAGEEDAQKVTGRVALLPVEEQEKFYADIAERYNALIRYLDETGENTLKITTLPLKAKTLSRKVGTEGRDPNGNNPFAQNSYVERVEVDVLKKPMKSAEIRKVRENLTGGKPFDEYRDALIERVNVQEKARLAAEEDRYARRKEKTQKEIDKQVAALEAKVKGMDDVTRKAEVARITGRLMANLEDDHNATVAGIKSQHRRLREKFEQFNFDETYLIHEELEGGNLIDDGYSPALFLGFKAAKEGDSLTPSTSVAVFATLDGRRRLEIKFTQSDILDEIANFTNLNYGTARETTLDNWDSSISNASREVRYILTGNILQAWDDAQREGVLPGRLVSYTDIDGNIKDGILMNQSWKPDQLRSSGVPINSRTEQILKGESVKSSDGEIEIEHHYGDWFNFYVPKSKKAGGKYWQNEEILGLVYRGNFSQYRGRFYAEVSRENMRSLLNILGKMGVRIQSEEGADNWEQVDQQPAGNPQDEEGTYFRRLTDPVKIAELEKEEKVPVYRSALFVPDPNGNVEFDLLDGNGKQRGFLYPPMSVKVDGKFRDPLVPGTYDEAEERPDLATDDGYFWLVDDNGDKMKVAYAPYLHNRVTPLNEQFSAAYRRNLVVIRSLVPKSELESNYSAEKSRKSTGMHDWPSGTVSNALAKDGKDTRKVILSRWAKIGEPVSYAEVADEIVELIGDRDLAFEYNVVSPGLRKELQKRGVRFEGWHGNKPKNVDEIIAGMQESVSRRGENLRNPIDRAAAIVKITEIANKLGVKFEEDHDLKAKGVFSPKTGKIRINIDAHKNTADLEATLLHEAVAHYGLRKLFGKDWKELRMRLYEQASPEIKARVDAIAKADGLSTEVAMEEYIAQLAEDGRFDEQEESFWQKIVSALKQLLAKIGFNSGYLTDEDFRAMLYASYRNLQTGGALETAARVATAADLRRNAEASHEDNGPEDDGPGGGLPADTEEDMMGRGNDEVVREVSADLYDRYENQNGEDKPWMSENELIDRIEEELPYGIDTKELFAKIDEYRRLDEEDFNEGRRDFSGSERDNVFREIMAELERLSEGETDFSELPDNEREQAEDMEIDQDSEEYYRRDRGYSEAKTADDMYDRRTSTVSSALYAAQVDEYAPLDAFQEAISEEAKKELSENERVSNRLRELGGQAMNEVRTYNEKFLQPMWKAIADLRKAVRGADGKKLSMQELTRYVGLKSGLERNELFAKRDAKKDAKSYYDKEYDNRKAELTTRENEEKVRLKARLDEGVISDVTYQGELNALAVRIQQLKDKAEADHQANVDNVDKETASEYRRLYGEYRQKDYSGLLSWFTEEADLKRSDYPSRKAYQRAVNAARKNYVPGVTDLASAEAMAKQIVDGIESRAGSQVIGNLWNRINAATKETLDFQYRKNMISRQQRADISASMRYYIPMRGFEDATAEDLYSYYMKPNVSGFAPTILAAQGRHTRYRSPFGMIGFMHSSAVSQGLKNEAKLELLDFVRRNPKNTVATVTRAWFVKTGETDADGKPIYEVAYPQVPEGATIDERERIIEDFETDMKERKERGEAYNAHREVQMNGGVVAFEKGAHRTEHIVRVMEGGREYGIVINGNPAAAQAVNGIKRQGGYENFLEIMRATRRVLSQMFTTLSIPFWVSNFQRDHGQGGINTFVRNNLGYVGKYIINRWELLPQMIPLVLSRAEQGSFIDRLSPKFADYYRLYLENGGPMGQNRIETDVTFNRQLERYLRTQQHDKAYIKKGARALSDLLAAIGEGVETITRFATFVTSMEYGRPLHQAIADSKEVSTNFARKGHGRSISWEETGRMETRSGRQLGDTSGSTFETYRNYVDRALIVSSSAVLELLRAGIPFFNAAIQGIKNKTDNYRKNWVKALLADGTYFAIGFAMRYFIGGAGGDDDKEKYGHTSDYTRRNNFLTPLGDGKYHKWALSQEYRYMYALGDITAEALLQEKPYDDLALDAFEALVQVLPAGAVDPSARGEAFWIDAFKSVMPGVVTPIVEAFENKDFKGSRIYDEGFNGNKTDYPGWTKKIDTTGPGYVKAAEWLNKVSGGGEENATVRGSIDFNPAIVEHFVKSYLSGPYQIIGGVGTIIGKKMRGEEITDRDIPVWNRVFMNTNDNSRDAYYSGLYYYFKDRDKESRRLDTGMRGSQTQQAKDFRKSKDYAYMLIFKKYESNERALNQMKKAAQNAGNDDAVKNVELKTTDIRERIAKECLDVYFDRVDWKSWLEKTNSGNDN